MVRLTWLVEFLVDIARGALGIAFAPRPGQTYVPAYAVIPRRAPTRWRRN